MCDSVSDVTVTECGDRVSVSCENAVRFVVRRIYAIANQLLLQIITLHFAQSTEPQSVIHSSHTIFSIFGAATNSISKSAAIRFLHASKQRERGARGIWAVLHMSRDHQCDVLPRATKNMAHAPAVPEVVYVSALRLRSHVAAA